jgi:ketosteroid isomerase-like protein
MAESANVAAVRRFVDAFNRREISEVLGDADSGIQLDEWPEAPGARSYRGPEGVREALDTWFETWEWMHVDIEELREVGDCVFFTLHQRAKGSSSGIEVEIKSWNVYTFGEGKLTRIQLFLDRDQALAAAGLTPDYDKEQV